MKTQKVAKVLNWSLKVGTLDPWEACLIEKGKRPFQKGSDDDNGFQPIVPNSIRGRIRTRPMTNKIIRIQNTTQQVLMLCAA